ncbi:hypothetical protein LTR91_005747 [Friedmanniomyces endolithicus]|uniref:Uncharacterized protein n=1 Tax=Friedmanniomyces endolithicus TaxID=329885 RepID=A0AAN6FI21_9PEZI|nr:hypothetical protein LTS09_013755 [Friedmanniomyces endolithicus]KAK0274703.1 hypothetical protein LTR35_011485 [Friedmanniomyces endolithicus]KAK0288409.1 hypothetical protein LTS00_009620 [Friedmanniomyces endolithicus]KAK0307939.1 hypothetical protein LTR01_005271 [Friedmanniomyces endolithicus]KAK0317868.1 hypothetical protein LTR82_011129 [Friedmanniomyces endolithicus]
MTLALFYAHSAVPEHSMLRFVTDRRRRETSTDWEDDEAGLRGIACYARSLTTLIAEGEVYWGSKDMGEVLQEVQGRASIYFADFRDV